jgi:hypothetical protein
MFNFKVKRETEKKDIEDKIIRSEVEKVKKRAGALEKEFIESSNLK